MPTNTAVEAVTVDLTYLVGAMVWLSAIIVAMGTFIRSLLMRVLDEAREERQARTRTDDAYDELREAVLAEVRRLKP